MNTGYNNQHPVNTPFPFQFPITEPDMDNRPKPAEKNDKKNIPAYPSTGPFTYLYMTGQA